MGIIEVNGEPQSDNTAAIDKAIDRTYLMNQPTVILFSVSLATIPDQILATKSELITADNDRWIKDSDRLRCMNENCNAQFTKLKRRHHCRRCGEIFCQKCVNNKVSFKSTTGQTTARVCLACFSKITNEQNEKETGEKSSKNDTDK